MIRLRRISKLFLFLLFSALIAGLLMLFPKVGVLSESMEPNLTVGEQLIVKRTNVFSLERGDIVVFYYAPTEERFVKRLIGLPGDVVSVTEIGAVFINGKELYEPYKTDEIGGSGTWEVPAGHYFFLGDNRAHSYDSRSWEVPFIPAADIIGKVVLRLNPLSIVR